MNKRAESHPVWGEGWPGRCVRTGSRLGSVWQAACWPLVLLLMVCGGVGCKKNSPPPDPPPGEGGECPDPGEGPDPGNLELALDVLVEALAPADWTVPSSAPRIATIGLPLPEVLAVPVANGRPALGVEGASGPWQWRVLDTWPDGSAKWVSGHVAVMAGAGQPATIGIGPGTGRSEGKDLACDLGGEFLVDTGPMQVLVRESGFDLLHEVVVDGVLLVDGTTPGGLVGELAGGAGALLAGPIATLTVEINGPALAVLRADLTLEDASGAGVIDATCRMTFEANAREVRVDLTLRNANIDRPQHTTIGGLDLVVPLVANGPVQATLSAPPGLLPGDKAVLSLSAGGTASMYQAHSKATTTGVTGPGPGYKPHIPKLTSNTLAETGTRIDHDGLTLVQSAIGNWPRPAFLGATDGQAGVVVAIKHMPYLWPAGLVAHGDGRATAGVFTPLNAADYTFTWRQHESRTAVFAFHVGPPPDAAQVVHRLDAPLLGRAADYQWYDDARVLAYDLVTLAEQDQVYSDLGIAHTTALDEEPASVTRFLPAHLGGGENNHASIEKRLLDSYLRHGRGGSVQRGLDLALYKSEWQILRSDGWNHSADPGAINPEQPHTDKHEGDKEHRYREGIIAAYRLTGDERFRDALLDELEILPTLSLTAQERSMYQTLRALVNLAEFFDADPAVAAPLVTSLRERLQFMTQPLLDVETGLDGFGWEGPPGQGVRGYFVNSTQAVSEKPEGENYITRGFITGTLGPLALHMCARYLGAEDPDGMSAAWRLKDLATYTLGELYPHVDDPTDRHLVYSYAVMLQEGQEWAASDFHTILLSMADAHELTCDPEFLDRGAEMIEAFAARDHLDAMDTRLEVQHYFAQWLKAAAGSP